MSERKIVHLFGQSIPHDMAWISGTREALCSLRDALTKAIETNTNVAAEVETADGEGYDVIIMPMTEGAMAELVELPYTDEVYQFPVGTHPAGLLPKSEYKRLLKKEGE